MTNQADLNADQNADGVALSSLLQLSMPVVEIERAVAFYRDTLGVRFLFQAGNLVFFDLDGVRLLVEVPEDAAFARHGSVLYFRVPNVEEAHAALLARGVDFVTAPHVVHRDERMELWRHSSTTARATSTPSQRRCRWNADAD